MSRYDHTQWLDIATAGILDPHERESAKQELLDHMEDHMADLLAAGFSREDAEKHAVFAMGDPEDTAKLLRRAHQPVLTRIIGICRTVAICLFCVLALTALIRYSSLEFFDPVQPGGVAWFLQHDPLPDSVDHRRVVKPQAKGRLGAYGVEVEWVSVSHMPGLTEENYPIWGGEWDVAVHVKFTRPPFSDQPQFQGGFTLDDGRQTSSDHWHYHQPEVEPDPHWYLMDITHEGSSPTADWYTLKAKFARDPDGVTLRYVGKDLTFELPIDLKGGVEYGKAP